MPATVRTAKKLLLGREIAHMIESAGASQSEAAKLIETSQSRIALLINGGGSISPGDLVMLADKLGFNDEGYQEALRELRRDNHKRGFWATGHNRAYSEDIRLLVDLEQHADQMRAAEVEVVPGLLQCESYVRAMHADEPNSQGVPLEDDIKARLARQNILDKPEPPGVQFVLSDSASSSVRRHRFYFDLSLKRRDEDFAAFVTRTIAPCMSVEHGQVFDVFHYLIRSGSVVCALDGIDEAVPEHTLDGFLGLFAELAQVLSAESAVVMSSRVSFLEDSPHVLQLLDQRALVSERLVQQLYAHGVDPLRIPQFSVLQLHDLTTDGGRHGSPLELHLAD